MKLSKVKELLTEYASCPECGNSIVGGGEGTLTIDANSFERTCKCGWSIKVQEY